MTREIKHFISDLLESINKIEEYTEDISCEQFMKDARTQDAVIRRLEIIGEAARRVSQDTRDAYPDLPWAQMIGMRNRLIHEYFRVNLTTVWETVQDDLPSLIALIEPLVPPEHEN